MDSRRCRAFSTFGHQARSAALQASASLGKPALRKVLADTALGVCSLRRSSGWCGCVHRSRR
eukprot:2782371-Alexandrium_andersonii.AAC.1